MPTIMLDGLRGTLGRIYIARKGTLTVIIDSEGTRYWVNNLARCQVIYTGNLVDAYWVNAIDWAGGFIEYMVNGVIYDTTNRDFYPKAKPIVELTDSQIKRLILFFMK